MENQSIKIKQQCFIACFIFIIQVLAVCSAASIGDMALCPYEIKIDEDPTRLPMVIKNHNCRKSVIRNVDDKDQKLSPFGSKTCEDIGGHCVQEQETIKVTYRHRAMSPTVHHRKHDVRYNRSCVCVALRGLPAEEILPDIKR